MLLGCYRRRDFGYRILNHICARLAHFDDALGYIDLFLVPYLFGEWLNG